MKSIFFSLILVCIFSCEPNGIVNPEVVSTTACGTPNPLEEVDWLKVRIEAASGPATEDYCHMVEIIQGDYLGETVFIPILSGHLCDTCGNAVYNCKGEEVFVCDQEKEAKIKNKKVIWKRD